jgi:hypothetical protein
MRYPSGNDKCSEDVGSGQGVWTGELWDFGDGDCIEGIWLKGFMKKRRRKFRPTMNRSSATK